MAATTNNTMRVQYENGFSLFVTIRVKQVVCFVKKDSAMKAKKPMYIITQMKPLFPSPYVKPATKSIGIWKKNPFSRESGAGQVDCFTN